MRHYTSFINYIEQYVKIKLSEYSGENFLIYLPMPISIVVI
jgi:hypothetical protein